MKISKKIIISAFLFTITCSAHAVPTLIDFKADANLLERGYLSLDNYAGLKITASGVDDDQFQYAYMDSRSGANVANGGLGACMDVNSSFQCNPSSDDNVTVGESLHMVWDNDIVITGIWFNNNHDSDFNLLGNTISIEGDNHTFLASDFDASRSSGANIATAVGNRNADFFYGTSRYVSASTMFDISYFDDQFYISAIQYETTVPEPGILALLSVGLIGLGAARRRK